MRSTNPSKAWEIMDPKTKAVWMMKLGGYDPDKTWEHFEKHGHIRQGPGWLVMACDAKQMPNCDGIRVDALYIWLAVGRGALQKFCELAPPGTERIAFARELKGRKAPKIYDFQRFKRICSRITPSP